MVNTLTTLSVLQSCSLLLLDAKQYKRTLRLKKRKDKIRENQRIQLSEELYDKRCFLFAGRKDRLSEYLIPSPLPVTTTADGGRARDDLKSEENPRGFQANDSDRNTHLPPRIRLLVLVHAPENQRSPSGPPIGSRSLAFGRSDAQSLAKYSDLCALFVY